jgi:hypothetical protein
MLFELTVRFNFDFERLQMSKHSEKLAEHARRFRTNRPIEDQATILRNKILDDGFARLRDDLRNEFVKQVDELNGEPGCANLLVCRSSENELTVSHTGEDDLSLFVTFDSPKRLVTITCEKPTKIRYFVEVRLVPDNTRWYFVFGEKKNDLASCGDNFVWLVNKALDALFGREA